MQTVQDENLRVSISFWFVTVLCLMFLIDEQSFSLLSLSAFFLHEFTHIFFVVVFGGRVTEFSLSLGEMNIKTEREFLGKIQNIVVSLSAPLLNLLLAILFWEKYRSFAEINAVIGFFQLLPIISLDGDVALESLKVSLFIRKTISFVLIFAFAVLGFALLLYSKYNFTLLFVSFYLLFITCKTS